MEIVYEILSMKFCLCNFVYAILSIILSMIWWTILSMIWSMILSKILSIILSMIFSMILCMKLCLWNVVYGILSVEILYMIRCGNLWTKIPLLTKTKNQHCQQLLEIWFSSNPSPFVSSIFCECIQSFYIF